MSTRPLNTLESLLREEIGHARKLLEVLRAEFESLKGRDPAAIEQAALQKQECVTAFDAIEKRRAAAMRPDMALERLVPDPLVRQRIDALWSELREVARECQAQNQVNGGIAELGRRRSERCLEILLGQDPGAETYGPGGKRQRTRPDTSGVTA